MSSIRKELRIQTATALFISGNLVNNTNKKWISFETENKKYSWSCFLSIWWKELSGSQSHWLHSPKQGCPPGVMCVCWVGDKEQYNGGRKPELAHVEKSKYSWPSISGFCVHGLNQPHIKKFGKNCVLKKYSFFCHSLNNTEITVYRAFILH
jgi:hypothetical protein